MSAPCAQLGSPLWSAGSAESLSIAVRSNGCFTVSFGSAPWLTSAVGAELVVDNAMLRSAPDNEGALKISGTKPLKGSDGLGNYSRLEVTWTAPSSAGAVTLTNSFTLYEARRMVEFGQVFHSRIPGANLTGTNQPTRELAGAAWGRPSTAFPVFDASGGAASKLGGPDGLGYVAYGEIGISHAGRFPTNYKYNSQGASRGNEEDGVPLALLDEATGTAAVLAPSDGGFDNVFDYDAGCGGGAAQGGGGRGCLRTGVPGTYVEIPAGFGRTTALGFSRGAGGLSEAWLEMGDMLLARTGKPRTPADSNAQVGKLGYASRSRFT